MNIFDTLRRPSLVAAALTLTACVVLVPCAGAEPPVDAWDHYKVYDVLDGPPYSLPVYLQDQFVVSQHSVLGLRKFANPVQKTLEDGSTSPIFDPRLHYAWWEITPHPFDALVAATNQFGDQTFRLSDPRFLLNPALKNELGTPPIANHYKCYACDGTPINRVVTMDDQFGQWQAMVTFPRWFCNPVQKTDASGLVYPIIDARQHYVCYEFQDPDPRTFTAFMVDQFVYEVALIMTPSRLLCVPTDKLDPTPTDQGTWGRLKTMYR